MYNYNQSYQPAEAAATSVSQVMKRVYLIMTIGLAITGFVSFFCANSLAYLSFMVQNSWAIWVLMLLEVGIVLAFTTMLTKMSSTTAFAIFFIFALVNGLSLAPIFLLYTGASIAKTFFITAGTFGAMSAYGYFTDRDLSKMGSILFMALIGLIIASIVNIFAHSTTLMWIISFAGVLIFVGLTAWDTQKIKNMIIQMPASSYGHIAAIGALSLYLDFINLFLYLLRFFGSERN